MKHLFQTALLTLLAISFILPSCKKQICETCLPNPSASNTNKTPIAVAGPDQTITLPTDSILLDGSASNDPGGRIAAWQWAKISGPSTFNIVNANSVQAPVINLAVGIYQFELTVTNSQGLFDKDTTTVTVNKVYENEKIFNDQGWVCNDGVCWLFIPDLHSHLPAGASFKVFIKRDDANTWVEVGQDLQEIFSLYAYSVSHDGQLEIYIHDPNHTANDTPDIKIIY